MAMALALVFGGCLIIYISIVREFNFTIRIRVLAQFHRAHVSRGTPCEATSVPLKLVVECSTS